MVNMRTTDEGNRKLGVFYTSISAIDLMILLGL